MTGEQKGEAKETKERKPPKKRPPIVRILRALKRYQNRSQRRHKQRTTEHQSNERMMARWTRHVGLFTGALVLVSIVTAVIFWRQLDVMNGQLKEARIEQRPWIAIEAARALTPLLVTPDRIEIDISFLLRNTGHTPALSIFSFAKLYPMMLGKINAEEQKSFCQRASNTRLVFSGRYSALFPGETTVFNSRAWMDKGDLAKAKKAWAGKQDFIMPMIMGCVVYNFADPKIAGERPQTPFAFRIYWSKAPAGITGFTPNQGSVPIDSMEISPDTIMEGAEIK